MKTVRAIACGAVIGLCVFGSAMAGDKTAAIGTHLVAMRRITQEQYRQIIADVFGRTINLGGRFEPDQRDGGLIAVGAGQASVTASGFEQYDGMARTVADQVVDEQHRAVLIPCKPAAATGPDESCARQFLGGVGRLLYRRPLTELELDAELKIARDTALRLKDFYAGLGLCLAGMLDSAQFLFRQEMASPDSDHAGIDRLDAYSKASRLSFLLWNSGPDVPLLNAAERGDLDSGAGLRSQVDRMMKSPRLEAGVRAFFADMLGFSAFESLAKDPVLYPKFSLKVADQAQEQTLRTIVDHLLTRGGDYRDLFTTRRTFLTPLLAAVYQIPIETPDDLPDAWAPYEFPRAPSRPAS